MICEQPDAINFWNIWGGELRKSNSGSKWSKSAEKLRWKSARGLPYKVGKSKWNAWSKTPKSIKIKQNLFGESGWNTSTVKGGLFDSSLWRP